MDPPWQLASKAPTRGVALGYSQLPNRDIMNMKIPLVQSDGFLFIWVINSRYKFALDMMKNWGYTLVVFCFFFVYKKLKINQIVLLMILLG